MPRKTLSAGVVSVAAISAAAALGGAVAAGADDIDVPPPDPAIVALRTSNAMTVMPAGYTSPPEVQDTSLAPGDARMAGTYLLDGRSTADGYIHVSGRDNPAQDKPGPATTTMRIYGNVGAFRTGAGQVSLKSQFTCTGAGISSLTIGTGSFSVSGGKTSSTLTWNSSRSSTSEVRQGCTEDGHFRCKASNATPAKTTRRVTGMASYKNADVRAQDDYSFWW